MRRLEITLIKESNREYINDEEITSFVEFMSRRLDVEREGNLQVNILLCDDSRITELNRQFLNRNGPTDVLSFYGYSDNTLGDIAISLDTAEKEADKLGVEPFYQLLFLIAHGFLHLLGYEHETMEEYEKMISLQKKLIEEWKNEKNS